MALLTFYMYIIQVSYLGLSYTQPLLAFVSSLYQVARDRVLKEWRFPENIEFSKDHGSGYPSGTIFNIFRLFYHG